MTDLVLTAIEAAVGIITLNRPDKHNALNDELSGQLREAMAWAADDEQVRAVLLRGAGKSFSSGRDTTQLGRRPGGDSDFHFIRGHQQGRLRQLDCPKPVVAAVRGYALGGAFELALAADIRIFADDAKVGFPEVRHGLMTDTGGAPLATLLAGPSKAKWLLMTGDLIDARQAEKWGLADQVVTPAELDKTALNLAARLAAAPPLAVAMIKQVVDEVGHGALHGALRAELLAASALFTTKDRAEAAAAYRDKRQPAFEGR